MDDEEDAGHRSMYCDIRVSDEKSIERVIRKILMRDDGDDAWTRIALDRVRGGITNQLYRATIRDEREGTSRSVLVRIYGAEGMIDRTKECATFRFLGSCGIAPKYVGGFRNGRLEEWLEGYAPLALEDMSNAKISTKVAAELARVHSVQLPPSVQKYYGEGSAVWNQLRSWLKQARVQSVDGDAARGLRPERLKLFRGIDFDRIDAYITDVEHRAKKRKCAVRFCHNDCLYGNIMLHSTTGKVRLIDFEYGGPNYVAFDIANHFNEWTGGTGTEKTGLGYHGTPNYNLFPSKRQQEQFCAAYLSAGRGGDATPVNTASVRKLLDEVQLFLVVNDIYWGLWGVNQAFDEGCDEFDYMKYGATRIAKALEKVEEKE